MSTISNLISSREPSRRAIIAGIGMTMLAVTALNVVMSTPAAAGGVPQTILLNTPDWSGSAGFGSSAPAWFKDGNVVHLQGAAKRVSAGGLNPNFIGALPAVAAPPSDVYTIAHTFAGTYVDIQIDNAGLINVIAPRPPAVEDLSFVSLEGIEFVPGVWNTFSLNTTNWSGNAGFGSDQPSWYKDVQSPQGIVYLAGAVTQWSLTGSNPNLIGTLPLNVAPPRAVYTIVHTFAGTYADLLIDTNGQIWVISPRPPAIRDYTFLSLEGVSYSQYTGGVNIFKPTPFPVHKPDWSANAGFGSTVPAWFEQGSVVHLQGAAKRVAKGGSNPNVIATLPLKVAPHRDVYTIVHTFDGTYADLVVDTQGRISIISPRAPAVADFSFVSLEGITYQP